MLAVLFKGNSRVQSSQKSVGRQAGHFPMSLPCPHHGTLHTYLLKLLKQNATSLVGSKPHLSFLMVIEGKIVISSVARGGLSRGWEDRICFYLSQSFWCFISHDWHPRNFFLSVLIWSFFCIQVAPFFCLFVCFNETSKAELSCFSAAV